MRDLKVLIVGGGIGGLTAAASLKRLGFSVTVFEAADEFSDIGFGLLLGANAVKTLSGIGLASKIREAGAKAEVGNLYSESGRVLTDVPSDELRRRVGEDSYAIHRADLQRILIESVGSQNIVTGARCAGFTQSEGSVTARFEDGTEHTGDVLVGADGINSVVRRQLFGSPKLRYAGYTAWRGLANLKDGDYEANGVAESIGDSVFETWGRGTRFGCARIDPPESPENRVYWFATRNAPEGGCLSGDERTHLLEIFDGWHVPVQEIVSATKEQDIRRDDIYDARPLATWSRRSVTLVGDAAHPMTPNLGQGACQAMEDGFALGISLRGAKDMCHALMDYEFRRVQRVKDIVGLSRRLGRVGQIENPLLCSVRNMVVGNIPSSVKMRQFEKVLGSA